MRRTLKWSAWSGWKTYAVQRGVGSYRMRNCKLMCGKIIVATLVESDVSRYGAGNRCFMYSATAVTKGATPFRTAREFIRRFL